MLAIYGPLKANIFNTLFIALFLSLFSLAVAFIAQYGFGLHPCELCVAQRIPYVVVIVLSVLGLYKSSLGKGMIVLVGIAFFIDGGIASYHAAVEKHWVPGPSACTDSGEHPFQSMEEFLNKINHAPLTACDQPQWEWHGLTMASLNALWAFVLAWHTFVALQQIRRRELADA